MKHKNIAIFVPHAGCPHACSFCNQKTITAQQTLPQPDDVVRICTQALAEIQDPSNAEIAFFGGSFTAIPQDYMTSLLKAAQPFLGAGRFAGIRISTRPDCISEAILRLLLQYGVTAIELGAQSMDDAVLRASGDLALHVLEIMEAIHVSSDERKQVKLTSTCAKPEMMPII